MANYVQSSQETSVVELRERVENGTALVMLQLQGYGDQHVVWGLVGPDGGMWEFVYDRVPTDGALTYLQRQWERLEWKRCWEFTGDRMDSQQYLDFTLMVFSEVQGFWEDEARENLDLPPATGRGVGQGTR